MGLTDLSTDKSFYISDYMETIEIPKRELIIRILEDDIFEFKGRNMISFINYVEWYINLTKDYEILDKIDFDPFYPFE